MTEEEARSWVRQHYGVSRETALERFGDILCAEAERQNLIAASTLGQLWGRHLVDSAQLLPLAATATPGPWIDIGSGAGLPGLVIALLNDQPMILVEPRAKRATFLAETAEHLGLSHVRVAASRVETFRPEAPAAVISARAVSQLAALFASAHHCANSSTVWLLPKGRNVQSEVEAALRAWQGSFHVEPSITSPESGIVVARKVRRK